MQKNHRETSGFIKDIAWDLRPAVPSGNLLQFAIENSPVEIVDVPINSMVIFHSYVNVYQRVNVLTLAWDHKFPCLKLSVAQTLDVGMEVILWSHRARNNMDTLKSCWEESGAIEFGPCWLRFQDLELVSSWSARGILAISFQESVKG